MANLYTFYTPYSTGELTVWEAEQVTMCVCDPGYTGTACEMSKFLFVASLDAAVESITCQLLCFFALTIFIRCRNVS